MSSRGSGGTTARRWRDSIVYRGLTVGALLVMVAMLVLPRLASAEDPYTTISPKSETTDDIQFLYELVFWLALAVFIGVQMVIVWTVLRFRRRGDSDERPVQVHGNKTLEIAWTIIPAVILVAIFIPTVQVLYDTSSGLDDSEYVVEVYGKQWWWEVHYKKPDAIADVITANDIYVPVGKQVTFKLNSTNVIHSFYVPQLSGTMDLIPGHTNAIKINAREPGMYYGECKEFCGTSHAYMRFKVIAVPQEQFDRFVAGWRQGANSSAAALVPEGDIERTPDSFNICLACHRVGGVDKNAAGIESPINPETIGLAGGDFENRNNGPNLSMLACRSTLAAGMLPNDEEHLRKWLYYPDGVKPGNYMGLLITAGYLDEQQINELVAYLKTLAPEDGCPEITGINEGDVLRLADEVPVPAQASEPQDAAALARPGVGFVA